MKLKIIVPSKLNVFHLSVHHVVANILQPRPPPFQDYHEDVECRQGSAGWRDLGPLFGIHTRIIIG